MTAAHPKLPLGAEVTVTDTATGRQVEVEVNDRGPYAGGRDIDLSQGAAKKLGITQEGVAKVTIEATKQQVEEAIERPKDVPKVERQLEEARRASAAEGTPQPKPLPPSRRRAYHSRRGSSGEFLAEGRPPALRIATFNVNGINGRLPVV